MSLKCHCIKEKYQASWFKTKNVLFGMWRHGLHVVPSSADGPLMPKHIDETLYRHSIFDDSSDKIDLIILTKCMTTIQSCLIEWFYMLMNPPLVVCQKIDSNRLACQLNYYHFRLAWYCPTNQATTTTAASASGWRILCESCPPKRRTTSRTRAS